MPAKVGCNWEIELPKGESFGFVVRNYGTAKLEDSAKATLCVRDKADQIVLTKSVNAIDNVFRINLAPEDTQDMEEGVYLYDIIIEEYDADEELKARHTVFAPRLRPFVIGRVADV